MKREVKISADSAATILLVNSALGLTHRSGKRRGDVCDGEPLPKRARFCRKGMHRPHAKFVHHGKNAGGRRTGIAGAHSGRIAQGTPV